LFLLNTNHCSRILEGEQPVLERFVEHRSDGAATCVIVQGELFYMAHFSQRTERNVKRVSDFLGAIQIHSIDEPTCDLYGRIKTAAMHKWGPKERAKRRNFDLGSLGFSDNDLWIAAIALRHGLIVVSGDKDFARIAEVSDLRHESWLSERTESE
jgi:tRNA(fMet)-specific endonuclease VapC